MCVWRRGGGCGECGGRTDGNPECAGARRRKITCTAVTVEQEGRKRGGGGEMGVMYVLKARVRDGRDKRKTVVCYRFGGMRGEGKVSRSRWERGVVGTFPSNWEYLSQCWLKRFAFWFRFDSAELLGSSIYVM